MPKYSLNKTNAAYLTIEIDGKNYNIPLAKALKVKEVRKLMKIDKLGDSEQFDFMADFLARYMGEKIVDEMTVADLQQIMNLWTKANNEADGLDLGES